MIKQVKIKNVQNMPFASHVSLQVLGCGGLGSPKGLIVTTTNVSYLFNCGEGIQRLAFEYHYKLTKANNIFITTPVWSNLGGLPGFALTVEKGGQIELNLHGPEGTNDILEAIKNFVTFKTLKVTKPCLELSENGNSVYEDINMKVEYVSLKRKQKPLDQQDTMIPSLVLDDINYYDYQLNDNNKRESSLLTAPKKARKIEIDLNKGRITSSMAYICKLHPKQGTLDIKKCIELGITPGPILGKLKAGQDVTLTDGKVVKSEDVCSKPIPGPVFIVIDCYDEDVLESLLINKSFDKHFAANKCEELIPYCIVHFTPENILHNPKYKEWMLKFGSDTQHLIINEQNNCMSSEGINIIQHQLHVLHPTIFPLLMDEKNGVPGEINPECNAHKDLLIYQAKNHDTITLRPLKGFHNKPIDKALFKEKLHEMYKIKDFEKQLDEFQSSVKEKTCSLGQIHEYPKLTMLGTGSSIPSKTRNTSGMLLQMSKNTSMILDCGEGTVGQMYRLFGKEECHQILSTIKGIYVSHLHADHHIGLIGLLQERHKVNKEPVYLFAPEPINSWLQFYNAKFEEITKCFELVSNQKFYMQKHSLPQHVEKEILHYLELKDLNTAYMKHCAYSYGVSLLLANDKKIVYSGDTMPCDNLIILGNECDLLIHEATHEDDMEEEAKLKRHSTLSQAINVGQKMKAKHILLTHFSQRYAKMARIVKNELDLKNVGFAYDNMQIRLHELPLLPLFYPILRIMFSDFCKELEMKAAKRIGRLQEQTVNDN